MGRLVRIAVIALALVAILLGSLGSADRVEAGNGYEQWVMSDDGCGYYWDGYNWTWSGCFRSDGGIDFYYNGGGQWVYFFSSGWLSDGGTWLYYQGIYYYDTATGYIDGVYQTTFTGGGPIQGLTNNAVANQFILSMVGGNSVWTTPTCVYILYGVCYY